MYVTAVTTAAVRAERTSDGCFESRGMTKHTPDKYVISVSVVNWSMARRTFGAVIGTGTGPNLASKVAEDIDTLLLRGVPKKEMEKNDALALVQEAGDHVVVEAVPGAGKTHMIVELASKNANSLILAYNNALALEIQSLIDPDRVSCFTFHSLCSRFVRVVRDDLQLRSVVEEVERGELLVERCSLHATTLLIDEAQDVRPIYIRLLRILGLFDVATKIYVFGDRNQLIYDYDDDFPASLDVLTRPNTHVRRGVSWKRVVASTSHRLPSPVARIVSDMFSVRICSAVREHAPLVEVRAPTSMFRL